MSDCYDIETIDGLSKGMLRGGPSLHERENLKVGDLVRMIVFVNGEHIITPTVTVVEVDARGSYVGEVGGLKDSPDWHPYGTRVSFTAGNVLAINEIHPKHLDTRKLWGH